MNRTKNGKMIGGAIFILVGIMIAVVGAGIFDARRTADTENWNRLVAGEGKEIEGTFVALDYTTRTEGSRRNRTTNVYYCPAYEFVLIETKYRVKSVGDDCEKTRTTTIEPTKATILYDPKDPNVAFVKSSATTAFYENVETSRIVAMALGVLFVVIGAIFLAVGRRQSTEVRMPGQKDPNSPTPLFK